MEKLFGLFTEKPKSSTQVLLIHLSTSSPPPGKVPYLCFKRTSLLPELGPSGPCRGCHGLQYAISRRRQAHKTDTHSQSLPNRIQSRQEKFNHDTSSSCIPYPPGSPPRTRGRIHRYRPHRLWLQHVALPSHIYHVPAKDAQNPSPTTKDPKLPRCVFNLPVDNSTITT